MGWPYPQKPPMGWPLDYDSGLVPEAGFWPFLEGSGNKVFDLSGNGNTGSLVGTAYWGAGNHGSAVILDGDSDYIRVPASSLITNAVLSENFTVVVQWQTNDLGGTDQAIFDLWVNTNNRLQFYLIAVNSLRGYCKTDGSQRFNLNKTTSISTTGWYQIVVVVTPTSTRIYVNGLYESNFGDAVCDQFQGSPYLTFGHTDEFANNWLNGSIGGGMIYNQVLSATEIAKLYREPFCMFKSPAEVALLGGYQAVAVGNPWNYYAQCA